MFYVESLLWIYFIITPIYVFFTHKKDKQKLIDNPSLRIPYYQSIVFFLWLPTLLLIALVYFDTLSLNDLGLKWQFGLANQIGLFLTLLLAGYAWLSIKQIRSNQQARNTFMEQIEGAAHLMPINLKEVRWFVLGVCISAGICEELLFRGYLIHFLGESMPVYAAVFLSSIAFGLPHIYQGVINALKTAFLGAVMCLIYLFTESIVLPIILHALIDIYFGLMFYVVHSNQNEKLGTSNFQTI